MVDIPSFFKKPDFYGVLLPGYLTTCVAQKGAYGGHLALYAGREGIPP